MPENPLKTDSTMINPAVLTVTPMMEMMEMILAALPFLREIRYRSAMKSDTRMVLLLHRCYNQSGACRMFHAAVERIQNVCDRVGHHVIKWQH